MYLHVCVCVYVHVCAHMHVCLSIVKGNAGSALSTHISVEHEFVKPNPLCKEQEAVSFPMPGMCKTTDNIHQYIRASINIISTICERMLKSRLKEQSIVTRTHRTHVIFQILYMESVYYQRSFSHCKFQINSNQGKDFGNFCSICLSNSKDIICSSVFLVFKNCDGNDYHLRCLCFFLHMIL